MNDGKSGRIGWIDVTVPNAEDVRDFYARVPGWRFAPEAKANRVSPCCVIPLGPPSRSWRIFSLRIRGNQ